LSCETIEVAVEALRSREDVPKSGVAEGIGRWHGGPSPDAIPSLEHWASQRHVDAVVWTRLGYRSKSCQDKLTAEQTIEYLQALPDATRHLAEEYVRRAPAQIATAYRKKIEDALGWTPTG
jgi:hypothetical protein